MTTVMIEKIDNGYLISATTYSGKQTGYEDTYVPPKTTRVYVQDEQMLGLAVVDAFDGGSVF